VLINLEKELRATRLRRGSPAITRERLIAAAALLFNRAGYHGTDSNRIARQAGYSPGVFYKHFTDKREIFLAVYENWVAAEWKNAALHLQAGGPRHLLARRLIENLVEFHTRWKGLRASLIELVFADLQIRRFYRDQRRRQLNLMAALREQIGAPRQRREDDAILLFTLERTGDALAHDELRDLGVNRNALIKSLEKKVAAALS
jgi:AcrR family transcriptional regulator